MAEIVTQRSVYIFIFVTNNSAIYVGSIEDLAFSSVGRNEQ